MTQKSALYTIGYIKCVNVQADAGDPPMALTKCASASWLGECRLECIGYSSGLAYSITRPRCSAEAQVCIQAGSIRNDSWA